MKLDKFYTQPSTAKHCISLIENIKQYDVIIEPSAGNGSFSNLLPDCLAYDLEPEHPNIIQQDFFNLDVLKYRFNNQKILVVGNPPYGKMANLAVKFFNHAATFATTIAFIVPICFVKESIHNKLNNLFHLKTNYLLDNEPFMNGDQKTIVPSVFQIWHKKQIKRIKKHGLKPYGFSFVKPNEHYDYVIKRVGMMAGTLNLALKTNIESNYFIKTDIVEFDEIVKKLKFKKYNKMNSINKQELISQLNQLIKNETLN